MFVECYDEVGAQVYDTLLRTTLQDLKLARAIQDIKIYIDPRVPIFIAVAKLEKTSESIYLSDVSKYKFEDGILKITVTNEDYIPDILKALWAAVGRHNVNQPDRYKMEVSEVSFEPDNLLVHNTARELKSKVYDAIFRIMPEGFRMTRNSSKGNMICIMSSDEIIDEKYNEKFEEVIREVRGD